MSEPPSTQAPEYYAPHDVARILSSSTKATSVRTLSKWRKDGLGPPWVPYGATSALYPIREFEAWQKARIRYPGRPGPSPSSVESHVQ